MNTEASVPLLTVDRLTKRYPVRGKGWFGKRLPDICTVYGVSFTLNRGDVLGIVGESGSGKTTVARMIARLAEPSDGVVVLEGVNVLQLTAEEVRSELRRKLRVIFQDPDAVLNPGYPIGEGLARAIRLHQNETDSAINLRVLEILSQVGMDASYAEKYPDQLSGGEKRRVGVGRALCTNPSLIIADEPLSGLDVTLQEQVLSLLIAEQHRLRCGMILVSHDLDRVHQVCNRVAVMFGGRLVELLSLEGGSEESVEQYRHPYSRSLQQARRRMGGNISTFASPTTAAASHSTISAAGGADRAQCVFAGRCEREVALGMPTRCTSSRPELLQIGTGQQVACHFPDGP